LSIGLWASGLIALANALLRRLPLARALALFGLLTLDAVLGIATLRSGQPVVLSILHQIGAVAVLAAALVPPSRASDRRLSRRAIETRPGFFVGA